MSRSTVTHHRPARRTLARKRQGGPAGANRRPAGPRPPRRGPSALTIFLFLLPGLALFGVLVVAPILAAAGFSLFRWDGLAGLDGLNSDSFIGLDNYLRALRDDVFQGDLWRGLVLVVLSLLVQLPLSLALALLLHQHFPGRTVFRLLFFAPYVISEVIAGMLFSTILSSRYGFVNNLLESIGLEAIVPQRGWLGEQSIVLFVVFAVISWKYFGFHMIIYMAGRQSIPRELGEAASTDGATPWQVFRHVTLPLMGPTIRVTIFLSIIGVVQLFDMVWALTRGGPNHASETMAVTMYITAFGGHAQEYGYASAISVLMFLIAMIFALLYVRFVMRRDIEGAVTTMGGR